ncbi:hypothetical protein AB0J52_24685, partial [Spirillospora sp. NPDC049652]
MVGPSGRTGSVAAGLIGADASGQTSSLLSGGTAGGGSLASTGALGGWEGAPGGREGSPRGRRDAPGGSRGALRGSEGALGGE